MELRTVTGTSRPPCGYPTVDIIQRTSQQYSSNYCPEVETKKSGCKQFHK